MCAGARLPGVREVVAGICGQVAWLLCEDRQRDPLRDAPPHPLGLCPTRIVVERGEPFGHGVRHQLFGLRPDGLQAVPAPRVGDQERGEVRDGPGLRSGTERAPQVVCGSEPNQPGRRARWVRRSHQSAQVRRQELSGVRVLVVLGVGPERAERDAVRERDDHEVAVVAGADIGEPVRLGRGESTQVLRFDEVAMRRSGVVVDLAELRVRG